MWQRCLFPPLGELDLKQGEQVYVKLRSDYDTGAASVLVPRILNPQQKFFKRCLVQFAFDGSQCHVNPNRIYKLYGPKQVVVCANTTEYRWLARSQLLPTDHVVEIGSSYGVATEIIAQHCEKVIGLEISSQLLQEARERYPTLQFELLDALSPPGQIELLRLSGVTPPVTATTLAADSSSSSSSSSPSSAPSSSSDKRPFRCTVLFVDIGGNRDCSVVESLLPFLETSIAPRLIIVKSMELHAKILQQLQPAATPIKEVKRAKLAAKRAGRTSLESYLASREYCASLDCYHFHPCPAHP